MQDKILESRYAKALFDSCKTSAVRKQVSNQLNSFFSLLSKNKGAIEYLDNPVISVDLKKQLLDTSFKAVTLFPIVKNFLRFIIEKNRFGHITGIINIFIDFCFAADNIKKIFLISAVKLSPSEKMKIKNTLIKKFSSEIMLENQVKPEILGGIIIKSGDLVIDGSIAGTIEKIRQALLNK